MEIANQDKPDFDSVIREASKVRTGDEPIRIRVQPGTYHKEKGYVLWPGVSWTVLCTNLEEIRQFRKALDAFFDAIHEGGIEQVIETLKGIKATS